MKTMILITVFALSIVSISAQQLAYTFRVNGNRASRTVVLQTHAAKYFVQDNSDVCHTARALWAAGIST